MVVHADAEPPGHAGDRALEAGVVERDEAAAAVADEVMVVLAAGQHALEPRLVALHRHALDEPVLDQLIKGPVDARAPGPAALQPQRVLDLDGGQRAALVAEQIDDPVPRTARAESGAAQDESRVVAPAEDFRGHPGQAYPLLRHISITRLILIGW